MTTSPREPLWPTALMALLLAGCPGLLPASDRAFDASPDFLLPADSSPPRSDAVAARPDAGGPMAVDVPPAPIDSVRPTDAPPTPIDRPAAPVDVPSLPLDRPPQPADVGAPPRDVVAPRDVGVDPPNCGGNGNGGQPCCAGDRCNSGYICRAEACARCGGNREPCCPGDRCNGDRECQDDVCR